MTLRTTLMTAVMLCTALPALAGPPGLAPRPPRSTTADAPAPPERLDEIREREAELLAWIKENDPAASDRLQRLQKVDQPRYMIHLMRVARMMDRAESDPELVERQLRMRRLEDQIDQEIRLIKSAADIDREALARVKELVNELFEARQTERRASIEMLEAKIESLRIEIENRDNERKQVVDEYIDQKLAKPVDL